ncbi:MAG: 50S ribosomal protein L21 [Patescibacteria group bacterium]|nr:MAG: 50S ribosomal protein L21 [Patescibacteria group bacterium]
MKFAVIETGGKQYKISAGETLMIEKLPGDHKEGEKITFDNVLLVSDEKGTTLGTPYIKGAKIEAVFEETGKRKKVIVIRFKAKSRHFVKKGHRQPYTKVKIKGIV